MSTQNRKEMNDKPAGNHTIAPRAWQDSVLGGRNDAVRVRTYQGTISQTGIGEHTLMPYPIVTTTLRNLSADQPKILNLKHLDYQALAQTTVVDGADTLALIQLSAGQIATVTQFLDTLIPRGRVTRLQSRGNYFVAPEALEKLATDMVEAALTKPEGNAFAGQKQSVITFWRFLLGAMFKPLDIIVDQDSDYVVAGTNRPRTMTLNDVINVTYQRELRKVLLALKPDTVFTSVSAAYLTSDELRVPLERFLFDLVSALDKLSFIQDMLKTASSLVLTRVLQLANLPVPASVVNFAAITTPVSVLKSPVLDKLAHDIGVIRIVGDGAMMGASILTEHDFAASLELLMDTLADTDAFTTLSLQDLRSFVSVNIAADSNNRRCGVVVSDFMDLQMTIQTARQWDHDTDKTVELIPGSHFDFRLKEVCRGFGSTSRVDPLPGVLRLLARTRAEEAAKEVVVIDMTTVPLADVAAAFADQLYLATTSAEMLRRGDTKAPAAVNPAFMKLYYQIRTTDIPLSVPVRDVAGAITTDDEHLVFMFAKGDTMQTSTWLRDPSGDVLLLANRRLPVSHLTTEMTSTPVYRQFMIDKATEYITAGDASVRLYQPAMADLFSLNRSINTVVFWPKTVRDDLNRRISIILATYDELVRRRSADILSGMSARVDIEQLLGPLFRWLMLLADSPIIQQAIDHVINFSAAQAPTYEQMLATSVLMQGAIVRSEVTLRLIVRLLRSMGFIDDKTADGLLTVLITEEKLPERFGALFVAPTKTEVVPRLLS